MKFRKYGFHNPTEWEAAKALITTTDEEGNPICEVTSPLYSVDVLWRNEPLAAWDSAIVWPKPVGIHTFGAKHAAEYAKAYCEANPDAEYCNPPAPEDLV